MSFVSFSFLILFSLTFLTRLWLGQDRSKTPYLVVLLVASLIFYASFLPQYLFILLAVTGVDYFAGRRIFKSPTQLQKKFYLVLSLVTNLGLLGFYKYSHFALENIRTLCSWMGMDGSWIPNLQAVLPIGISFFTFESMSFTIDIYRGQLKPIRSYWRFLLFVAFFTHLVAGPIVRARELIYQFERKRRFHWGVCLQGLYLMILGFFFKMVVADNLAGFVDPNWQFGAQYHIAAAPLFLAGLFSCQIFSDFFGYTSIAIGAAYLLGFKLPRNFNSPYIASSFREFWTRWHITLSRWIRDYLYIPLGGNQGSRRKLFLTLMATMLLAGLWHGAAFTFILWGGLHGLALALERFLNLHKMDDRRPLLLRIFWFLVVQMVVLVAWIFFRAENTAQAMAFLGNIAGGGFNPANVYPLFPALLFVLPVFLLHLGTFLTERGWMKPASGREKAVLAALMLYLILTCYGKNNAFIYFQF